MGDDGLTFKEALEHAHRQWEAKVAAQIGEKFEEQLNLADALVAAMDKDLELAPIRGFIYQRPKKHSQTDGSLAAGNRFTGIPVRSPLGTLSKECGELLSGITTARTEPNDWTWRRRPDANTVLTIQRGSWSRSGDTTPIKSCSTFQSRIFCTQSESHQSTVVSLPTEVYRTKLSLAQARWLPRNIRLAPEAFVGDLAPQHLARRISDPLMVRRTPSPDPNDSDPAPGRMAPDAEDQIRLEGEYDGNWLLTPGLAGKRVDVMIKGVDSFPRTNKINVTDKMRQDNDKCVILLNGSKFNPSDLKKPITLFNVGGPTGRKASFPPPCISPIGNLAAEDPSPKW